MFCWGRLLDIRPKYSFKLEFQCLTKIIPYCSSCFWWKGSVVFVAINVFALHFHFRHATAVLLTVCLFILHFQFWLAHILGVTCLLTAGVFALHFHFLPAYLLGVTCLLTACVFTLHFNFWHALIVVFVYLLKAHVFALHFHFSDFDNFREFSNALCFGVVAIFFFAMKCRCLHVFPSIIFETLVSLIVL